MTLLDCKNLSVGYNSKTIVSGLNFTLNEGDYLYIVGENGSGKSTLLKTLLGLLKPISGEIVKGKGFIQSEIGYLPQATEIQRDFPANVGEIVISGCQAQARYRPFYSAKQKKMAEDNMKTMGILHLKRRPFRELSGGQQQRVLLARALCATQNLLLVDEPVTGLDPNATEEMYSLIKNLNSKGITIVMISHDLEATKKYPSHVLNIGDEIFFGTKDEFLAWRENQC